CSLPPCGGGLGRGVSACSLHPLTRERRARRTIFVALLLALVASSTMAGEIPPGERRSGYEVLSRETRAMQDDASENPGMLWVLDGEALWSRKAGEANRACADCHGDAGESMKGVAARYPAFDAARGRPVDLEQRINICRSERQKAPAFA